MGTGLCLCGGGMRTWDGRRLGSRQASPMRHHVGAALWAWIADRFACYLFATCPRLSPPVAAWWWWTLGPASTGRGPWRSSRRLASRASTRTSQASAGMEQCWVCDGHGHGVDGTPLAPATPAALSYIMREATKVLFAASAVLANGSVFARAGSAMVALVARSYSVPVIVLAETNKFHERVQLDAITTNELLDPRALMQFSFEGPSEAEVKGAANMVSSRARSCKCAVRPGAHGRGRAHVHGIASCRRRTCSCSTSTSTSRRPTSSRSWPRRRAWCRPRPCPSSCASTARTSTPTWAMPEGNSRPLRRWRSLACLFRLLLFLGEVFARPVRCVEVS